MRPGQRLTGHVSAVTRRRMQRGTLTVEHDAPVPAPLHAQAFSALLCDQPKGPPTSTNVWKTSSLNKLQFVWKPFIKYLDKESIENLHRGKPLQDRED